MFCIVVVVLFCSPFTYFLIVYMYLFSYICILTLIEVLIRSASEALLVYQNFSTGKFHFLQMKKISVYCRGMFM